MSIEPSEYLLSISIEPSTKVDSEKLKLFLNKLTDENCNVDYITEQSSDIIIVRGMDENSLDILISRMKNEYNIQANVGELKVALRENKTQHGTQFLEPVMEVKVILPKEYLGDIIKNLKERRGKILSQQVSGIEVVINAHVPLMNLLFYSYYLRHITQDNARYSMEFDRYAPIPTGNDPDDPDDQFPTPIALRA